MSSRVVVGVDGSDHAARALRWAAEEAVRRGVVLEVVHSWMPPLPLAPQDLFTDYGPLETASRAWLERTISELREEGGTPAEIIPTLTMQDAATALVGAADRSDLLVLGSRGRGGFAGLLLGSVSQKCVQHAACPVAVVPRGWTSVPLDRIVVGVDGSEASHQALRWAVEEAVVRGARLDVVNSWAVPRALIPFGPGVLMDVTVVQKASRSLLEQMVAAVAEELGEHAPDVALRPVGEPPAQALIETAADADLLVLGHRGRGGFAGLLLGSISQQCVHHAPCPVVVVRPASKDPGQGSATRFA